MFNKDDTFLGYSEKEVQENVNNCLDMKILGACDNLNELIESYNGNVTSEVTYVIDYMENNDLSFIEARNDIINKWDATYAK